MKIKGYRNLKPHSLEMAEGLHLLFGENGAGKTNFLESINILMGWGPFRSKGIGDIPCWNKEKEKAFVWGAFEGEESLEAAVGIFKRTVFKIGGKLSNASEIRMRVPSLSFLPGDMALVEGGPSRRRSFIDRLCAVLFPLYASTIYDYRKILKQKRAALEKRSNISLVNRAMAERAIWIWSCRIAALDLLKIGLAKTGELLPGQVELFLSRGGTLGLEDLREDFWESIKKFKDKEETYRMSIVGPHRDEIKIKSSGRGASEFFSRGHRRRTALALMLAAGWAVERKVRKKPILLLDEVMAELDMEGREILVKMVESTKWQTFVTTAEDFTPFWPGQVWNVEDGKISPMK
ncbi:MAG: DNA replication/repair protein RecF [Thermovirga sp.]|nr:DNA replication/repair protein RecF [Thermovirga sp.]